MANNRNISILPHNECCGCRACGDICPKKCIQFKIDQEGFFYPLVDESICISCGKCINVCPEINQKYNPQASEAIAAYATDGKCRNDGSSGGVFGLLAQTFIKEGGKVWGASFNKEMKLMHNCASNNDEIYPLLKSKYLQSNTSEIYNRINQDIKNGIPTLFSGTPCQCNAIRNFLGDNDLLTTVEVVCHGVPSQDLFDKSIKWIEEKDNCHVSSFQFRSKYKNALHPHSFSYCKEFGNIKKTINGLHYQFPFYFGFQRYITLRPSCYSCKWACPERTADITLGDFWGIEKYDSSLDAKSGISQVILNTEKGVILFNKIIKDNSLWIEQVPFKVALDNNSCLREPAKLKPVRKKFFEALETEPFEQVVIKFLTPRRKWIFDTYYGMPKFLRKIVRRVMDKKMKYE